MKTKSILLAFLLAIQCAAAQDRAPKSDVSRPVAGGGAPIPFSRATVVAVTPHKEVVLKLSDGTIQPFKLAVQPAFFDKEGALIEDHSTIKGARVLAHFMVGSDGVLVDRLLMQP
jgi:hypothetical protein